MRVVTRDAFLDLPSQTLFCGPELGPLHCKSAHSDIWRVVNPLMDCVELQLYPLDGSAPHTVMAEPDTCFYVWEQLEVQTIEQVRRSNPDVRFWGAYDEVKKAVYIGIGLQPNHPTLKIYLRRPSPDELRV